MLSNLLAIVAGMGDKVGNWYFDNFGEAVIYALIGFGVVFVGIIIIIGVIWLVGLIMKKTNGFAFLSKKKDKKPTVKTKKVNVPEITELPADPESVSAEIPDEVKAAIVAAIMAYYQEKEEKCSFTVKRIKRI